MQSGRKCCVPTRIMSMPKLFITKTCLFIFYPLKPHFYIVKLKFTGVLIIFLISAQNIDCRYLLEPPRRGGSNEYSQSMFEQNPEKYQNFLSENFHFLVVKFSVYLNRHVFVMQSTDSTVWSSVSECSWENSPERGQDCFIQPFTPCNLRKQRRPWVCTVCQCTSPGFTDNPLYTALWPHSDKLDYYKRAVWYHWSMIITWITTVRKVWCMDSLAR